MVVGAFFFACMGIFTSALREDCDWQVIALTRTIMTLIVVSLWCLQAGVKLHLWRPARLWIRSLAGSVSLICVFYSLTNLPVADVLTVTNMFPVWVAVLSWPLLGEIPGAGVWVAVISGVAGVVLIQQPHILEGNLAMLAALTASLATSIAMIGLHRLEGVDPRAIVAHFSLISVFFCLGALYLFDRHADIHHLQDPVTVALLIGVGVCATVGQLCITQAFKTGSPAKVSVISLTQILFAMGLEWLIFGRTFEPMTLMGIALIALPTAWILTRRR